MTDHSDDPELEAFARALWASDEYKARHRQVLEAIADGSIYDDMREAGIERLNGGKGFAP